MRYGEGLQRYLIRRDSRIMKDSQAENKLDKLSPFQFVILVLSVYVLAALFYQVALSPPPAVSQLLDWIDTFVCVIFLGDFFYRLYRAPSKLEFLKWGWIDLISSIPALDIFRWGRFVRVFRILRMLRAFRGAKELINFLFRNRAKGTLGFCRVDFYHPRHLLFDRHTEF